MAENEAENKTVAAPPSVTITPIEPSVIVYANSWQVLFGESEITLIFGVATNPSMGQNPAQRGMSPVSGVTLTHSQFVKMAEEFERLSLVLQKMYDGPLPSIRQLNKEKLDAAIAKADLEMKSR